MRPDKREAILRGALTVFARDGYTRASIDAIAKEGEVSTRTLYNHFPSNLSSGNWKVGLVVDTAASDEQADALVDRLEDAYPERIQPQIREVMRSSEDPVEQAIVMLPGARPLHALQDGVRRVLQREVDVLADLLAPGHGIQDLVGDGGGVEIQQPDPFQPVYTIQLAQQLGQRERGWRDPPALAPRSLSES